MSELALIQNQEGLADLVNRGHARFLDCSNLTLEEAERLGTVLTILQRDVMFQLGDLARYCEARWPDTWPQAFPEWISPGLLARTAGVCRAYPNESDRQHEATYSQYMQAAGRPDRQNLLKEMAGQTTDETRRTCAAPPTDVPSPSGPPQGSPHRPVKSYEVWIEGYRATGNESGPQLLGTAHAASFAEAVEIVIKRQGMDIAYYDRKDLTYWGCRFFCPGLSGESRFAQTGPTAPNTAKADSGPRWILCVDVNYFLHRFWHSGAGVESAMSVASWVQRTVARLKEKGLTDVACCFDSHENHRKALTKEWEDRYKDRPPKDPELSQQLNLVRDLLQKANFACVSIEGMEADDVMASYAKQFDGKVTLLTQDKDCRQCLSAKCNILLDVEWSEDDTSGENLANYKWLTAKDHTAATGIPPERWIDYQCIMGDNVDGIRGVEGIGQKGAADLVKRYGTVEAVIQAAKSGESLISQKKCDSIIAFEPKLEITRALVTLKTDLTVPNSTRIG